MPKYVIAILVYLAAVNFATMFLMGDDKRRAKRGLCRIPERTLLLFAVAGGSVGGMIGMSVFHHKTKHPKFFIGIPAILIAEIAVVIGILRWTGR